MKFAKAILIPAIILLGTTASGFALAGGSHSHGGGGHWGGGHWGSHHGGHHGHGHVGVFIGVPLFWPWYYPGPYYYPYGYPYYYPPVVGAPPAPTEYIEQGSDQAGPQQPSSGYYWYHCSNPEGYYPYVKECPGGWQQVKPQPSPPA